jgi:hypothetical protein
MVLGGIINQDLLNFCPCWILKLVYIPVLQIAIFGNLLHKRGMEIREECPILCFNEGPIFWDIAYGVHVFSQLRMDDKCDVVEIWMVLK